MIKNKIKIDSSSVLKFVFLFIAWYRVNVTINCSYIIHYWKYEVLKRKGTWLFLRNFFTPTINVVEKI